MILKVVLFLLLLFIKSLCNSEFCSADEKDAYCKPPSSQGSHYKQKRYLLYDVNPGEGFNLRRDVYMRIATLVKELNNDKKSGQWILVLPPWGPLYHWKSRNLGFQAQIKWGKFFDLHSLQGYVPVIELEDFLDENGYKIDSLYYLQHYAEGWNDSGWEERFDIRDCNDPPPYERTQKGTYTGWFWGYDIMFTKEFHCLSIQGYSSTLKSFLMSSTAKVIMVDRAEVILHNAFGSPEYWMVRRSMQFSKKLIEIGDTFRKLHLNSTDENDKTHISESISSPLERKAVGGPYVSVHLRRRDFVQARPNDVPSILFASKQILKHMKRLNLKLLYVATDATQSEFEELQQYIPGATRFNPTDQILKDILDGGVAIVDQWICAHSKYFIGTYESTFSFRIQEEREILGFPAITTFNRLCGDNQTTCTQPSKWTIAF
ncbi:GDP-fucose protein O-fucosyltransferase 2 [Araneus ventricosus]|uniref:GDP-fucose protein O-fucosyltransferase 2 n=1 Tax=Araneus ventricosus TaxID=182803 RepID=A0A4Y2EQZ0_ARAVE|nr:GDP-fucose protein O-fucosyltransferase 2 [Araneus ventricosus]